MSRELYLVRRALSAALVFALAWACAAPVVIEDTATACANGSDDDGDGLSDCSDPSCDGSGACETTLAACSNRLDDDSDGRADCEQPSCVTRGYCASFEAACELVPQSGCPIGMGCYADDDTLRCRKVGVAGEGERCELGDVSLPHPCASAHACLGGQCVQMCRTLNDCPRESVCLVAPGEDRGHCTPPCDPVLSADGGCAEGYFCLSGHELAVSYETAGAIYSCFPSPSPLGDGSVPVGGLCDDPPSSSSDRICQHGLACVPAVDAKAYCRALCDVTPEGDVVFACPAGLQCAAFYPLDDRPLHDPVLLGACIEP